MNTECIWNWMEVIDTNKNGYANKWRLKTDCGHNIIMTMDNLYGKLYLYGKLWRQYLKSTPQCMQLGIKCPHCEKEINFWNDFE